MKTKWVYEAVCAGAVGTPTCQHWHHTPEAAERCAQSHIRAARRGDLFFGCNDWAKLDPKGDLSGYIHMESADFACSK